MYKAVIHQLLPLSLCTCGSEYIFFVIPLVGFELDLVLRLGLPRGALDVVQPLVLRFGTWTSSGLRWRHAHLGARSYVAMARTDSRGPHGTRLRGLGGRGRGGVVGGSFRGRIRCGLFSLAGARSSHGRRAGGHEAGDRGAASGLAEGAPPAQTVQLATALPPPSSALPGLSSAGPERREFDALQAFAGGAPATGPVSWLGADVAAAASRGPPPTATQTMPAGFMPAAGAPPGVPAVPIWDDAADAGLLGRPSRF